MTNQPTTTRKIRSRRDIIARARYYGWLIGAGYGEPYLCREEVGVRDLQQLL